jgi:quercetin dioxygenase-like cupin family protein
VPGFHDIVKAMDDTADGGRAVKACVFPDSLVRLDILSPGEVSRKVRAHGEKTMMVEVFFEKDAEGAKHAHPHEQLTYCLEGEFEFIASDKSWTLKTGDSILVPGNIIHGVKCLSRGRLLDIFSPPRADFMETTDAKAPQK